MMSHVYLVGRAHNPLRQPVHKDAPPPVLLDGEVLPLRLQQVRNDLIRQHPSCSSRSLLHDFTMEPKPRAEYN